MTSRPVRTPDPLLTPENSLLAIIDYQPPQVNSIGSMDRQLLVNNIVGVAKIAKTYGAPIIHSTVNVDTGLNQPPIIQLRNVIGDVPTIDRTSVNAWEDEEFVQAVEATGRKKLILTALWTEVCLAFPALDALREGYEVYVVGDAVGGTSKEAHDFGLQRIQQAGGVIISWTQLLCEYQRDWARAETAHDMMRLFAEIGGNAGLQFVTEL